MYNRYRFPVCLSVEGQSEINIYFDIE